MSLMYHSTLAFFRKIILSLVRPRNLYLKVCNEPTKNSVLYNVVVLAMFALSFTWLSKLIIFLMYSSFQYGNFITLLYLSFGNFLYLFVLLLIGDAALTAVIHKLAIIVNESSNFSTTYKILTYAKTPILLIPFIFLAGTYSYSWF